MAGYGVWNSSVDDLDDNEIVCPVCRGTGMDRWDEDCAECGGIGTVFQIRVN
jgi:RecJ-like exonuclease